jgi:tetratricopeptide (TPR) repeat protein
LKQSGNIYYTLKFYKHAILGLFHFVDFLEYTSALKINAGFAAAYYNRGRCLEELNIHHAAKIDFDSAFEIEPALKTMNISLVDIQ